MKGRIGIVAAATLLSGCIDLTDGATRLAYQIESEAAAFARSGASKITIIHRPVRQSGTGCGEDYRLQVDKVGAIIIWCLDSKTGETTDSHSTSYHGRFVDTAQTWIVLKKKGEAVAIDLQKRPGGKPVVVDVR